MSTKKIDKQIHMVRAAFCKPFTQTMQDHGIDIKKHYSNVHLPGMDFDEQESLLPEKPFWRLINQVAIEENFPDFGFQVARAFPWHRVESLTPLIGNCKSLGELIERFCHIASSQSSQVQFEFESRNGCCWFIANGTPLISNDIQMELYRVTCMIQLIQLAAGSKWQPKNIKLFMSQTSLEKFCPLLNCSTINFSYQQTAIEIPQIALELPIKLTIPYSNMDLNKYDINSNFIDSLRLILEVYIVHGHSNIDSISKAIDIPVRTLQRRLKALGTSYRAELDDIRYKLARSKLKNKNTAINEISSDLGYTDDAHFVRAFKRWSGSTPGEFRKE